MVPERDGRHTVMRGVTERTRLIFTARPNRGAALHAEVMPRIKKHSLEARLTNDTYRAH